MKIYNGSENILIEHQGQVFLPKNQNWDSLVNHSNLYKKLKTDIENATVLGDSNYLKNVHLLAPIATQEVWASGVTYLRSMEARMEESKESGGDTFYDKVYSAERPELFFKSTPAKVIGPGGKVRIRKDSTWNVPEPELTLFICTEGSIEGYTIGNDMSSRSIEGENPLYLPQAKTYDGAAALGPCLYVPEQAIKPQSIIEITIHRGTQTMYNDSISIDRMKRTHIELAQYLFRENSFETGVYLMTGTGIVPNNDFTLLSGDVVTIEIEGIGALQNTVA